MIDRIVVLRADDAFSFVADACAALAQAVNAVRALRDTDDALVETYAELVVAYGNLVRDHLDDGPHGQVRVAVIDHLIERLREARAGEIATPVLDVVDRLHAELTREPSVS
ncbi:MAG: hypothetical protein ACYDH6_08450 [Acidimicrobiales bacterium]